MILSIGSFVLLAGAVACAYAMPLERVYVVDVQHNVCAEKEVVDKEQLIFQPVQDWPLAKCDGNVSIAKEDWPGFRDWVRWAIQKVKGAKQHNAE